MNRQDIQEHYDLRHKQLERQVEALRHRNRGFVAAEIGTFVAFVALLAAYTATSWGWPSLLLSVVALLLYGFVRRADALNSERIERLEAQLTVARREINYMRGDYSCFDDGARYADSQHPYTFDMDIFGRDSLFQRVDRTVTLGGSDQLAEWLSEQHQYSGPDSISRIESRRQAVEALASLRHWRMDYMAEGAGGKIDTHSVEQSIKAVRAMPIPRWLRSRFSVAVAIVAWVGFATTIVLSALSVLPASAAVMWGVAQFFAVLMACQSTLRQIGRVTSGMQRQVQGYVAVMQHIDDLRRCRTVAGDDVAAAMRSPLLAQLTAQMDGALESSREMSLMLKSIDRRANVLGLIVFDTFLMHDFITVRHFLAWQLAYVRHAGNWQAAMSQIDALVSMATFRYNEPRATTAQLADTADVVYEAQGLYHPFLGDKAVSNDFDVKERNYYIVTGANMAGKSTFLRAIGVNYVLAMNGMPVFADRMHISVFSLFTSMRTTDDLTRGISYFNAELLRLKQLIGHCAHHDNTLIILDEILKGTNSADKLNGSRLFLEYIASRRVSGVIATHDLELSRMADAMPERFHNYCFEIELGNDVTYTYKITPGVARNQNATFLLRSLLDEAEREQASNTTQPRTSDARSAGDAPQ